jgi:hypothetical protein
MVATRTALLPCAGFTRMPYLWKSPEPTFMVPRTPTLSLGRAAGLWVAYVFIFNIAGGLAAGVLRLVFEAVAAGSFTEVLYAAVYGVTGFMAYRLARTLLEGK